MIRPRTPESETCGDEPAQENDATSSAHGTAQACPDPSVAASGAVEPAASVSSGTSVTFAVSLTAGATPCSGTDTFQVSSGSNGGESAIVPASTSRARRARRRTPPAGR